MRAIEDSSVNEKQRVRTFSKNTFVAVLYGDSEANGSRLLQNAVRTYRDTETYVSDGWSFRDVRQRLVRQVAQVSFFRLLRRHVNFSIEIEQTANIREENNERQYFNNLSCASYSNLF